jgi:hypothetical protein
MVSQITLCSATSFARGRWVTVGCTVSVCVGGHTYKYVPVGRCVCVTRSRGWGRRWLVSCWRARNTSRQPSLFQQLACTIESRGSEREIEKRRASESKEERIAARGCFACSHPFLAVLFKKLASSLRHSVLADTALSRGSGSASKSKREICSGWTFRWTFCVLNLFRIYLV